MGLGPCLSHCHGLRLYRVRSNIIHLADILRNCRLPADRKFRDRFATFGAIADTIYSLRALEVIKMPRPAAAAVLTDGVRNQSRFRVGQSTSV